MIILHNLDLVDYDWDYIWPLILIVIGIGLIYRATRWQHRELSVSHRYSNVFGDRVYEPSGEVDSLSYKHFIGDVEVNLARANLKPGEIKIFVSTFIGDIIIFLPKDTALKTRLSTLIGEISVVDLLKGGPGPAGEYQSPNYDNAVHKLSVAGNSFIGDIKIRQV